MKRWLQSEVHETAIADKCNEIEAAGATVFSIVGSVGHDHHAIVVSHYERPEPQKEPAAPAPAPKAKPESTRRTKKGRS